jgi:hypothetical protein
MPKNCRLIPALIAASAVVALLGAAPAARAFVLFEFGNHPQPGDETILIGANEQGTTITGQTSQSGIDVFFSTLTGETLNQNASGPAQITNLSGGNLTSINVTLGAGLGFTHFVWAFENGIGGADIALTANDGTFTPTVILGSGQIFLTVTTLNDEFLTNIAITGTGGPFGFESFTELLISGVCTIDAGGDCTSIPVPEPASLVLLGGALVGFGVLGRRRSRP